MNPMSEASLRQLLQKALERCASRSGKDEIFAASLASEVNALVREETSDQWASFTAANFGDLVKQRGIDCGLKGPRFREFLRCFPDMVTVTPTDHGDIVRWLEAEGVISKLQERKGQLVATALQTLAHLKEAGNSVVSASKLALQMKGAFTEPLLKSLGYDSFMGFLSSLEGVEVDRKTPGGKVWLKAEINPGEMIETGFLLVDGDDVSKTLYRLLGPGPDEDQRPDWATIANWVQERYPAEEWKKAYLIKSTISEQMKTFVHALGRIGYRPLSPNVPESTDPANQKQVARSAMLTLASKIIHTALKEKCRLVVVSHDDEVLRYVIDDESPAIAKTVILAFPEMLPDFVRKSDKVKIIDLEFEVRAFTSSLPRRLNIIPEDFDPMTDL